MDYGRRPLTEAHLQRILAAAPVAAVMNTRHERAKAGGWSVAPPDRDTFAAAALAEPNLLRRPILVVERGGALRALVGNCPQEMIDLLRG